MGSLLLRVFLQTHAYRNSTSEQLTSSKRRTRWLSTRVSLVRQNFTGYAPLAVCFRAVSPIPRWCRSIWSNADFRLTQQSTRVSETASSSPLPRMVLEVLPKAGRLRCLATLSRELVNLASTRFLRSSTVVPLVKRLLTPTEWLCILPLLRLLNFSLTCSCLHSRP